MQQRSKMQGLSGWGWLFMLLVFVSILTLVMRLGPHYLDNRSVVSVLEGITVEEARGPKSELRKLIDRRFTVNSIRDLDVEQVVDIDKSRENVTVTIEYEVREPIVANVSAVLSFREQRVF